VYQQQDLFSIYLHRTPGAPDFHPDSLFHGRDIEDRCASELLPCNGFQAPMFSPSLCQAKYFITRSLCNDSLMSWLLAVLVRYRDLLSQTSPPQQIRGQTAELSSHNLADEDQHFRRKASCLEAEQNIRVLENTQHTWKA
jgi:hypothetical protein